MGVCDACMQAAASALQGVQLLLHAGDVGHHGGHAGDLTSKQLSVVILSPQDAARCILPQLSTAALTKPCAGCCWCTGVLNASRLCKQPRIQTSITRTSQTPWHPEQPANPYHATLLYQAILHQLTLLAFVHPAGCLCLQLS
jgi:hypothetical protein